MRRVAALGALAILMTAVMLPSTAGAAQSRSRGKIIDATIAGQSLMRASRSHPALIPRSHDIPVTVTLRNDTQLPLPARYVRVRLSLLGLTFGRYNGSSDVVIAPGATQTVTVHADFYDVGQVATGWVDAEIAVMDQTQTPVASHPFSGSVNGKLWSSEGILLLEVLGVGMIGLIQILVGVSRRRLATNRFVRGLTFALTAGAFALAGVIAAAIAKVALLPADTWIPIVLLATVGGFVLGYVSPGAIVRTADERADEKVIDLVAAEAVVRASGEHARRTTGGSIAHASGDHTGAAAAHQSGGYAPAAHESGEFVAPGHDSGTHEPLE
jgi:hypothetical protein